MSQSFFKSELESLSNLFNFSVSDFKFSGDDELAVGLLLNENFSTDIFLVIFLILNLINKQKPSNFLCPNYTLNVKLFATSGNIFLLQNILLKLSALFLAFFLL